MRATVAAVAALVLVSSASFVRAQEASPASPADRARAADDDDSDQVQDRPHIQVLQHPYEISSFYRSSQGSSFDLGYEPQGANEKYPIAGFYRSHSAARGPYSMFWTSGY